MAQQIDLGTGPICVWPNVKLRAPSWSLWPWQETGEGYYASDYTSAVGLGNCGSWLVKWQQEVNRKSGGEGYRNSEDRNKTMTKDVHFCMPRMASCKLPSGPRSASAGAMMDKLMARTTVCARRMQTQQYILLNVCSRGRAKRAIGRRACRPQPNDNVRSVTKTTSSKEFCCDRCQPAWCSRR